jgi:hypothetical protein
LKKIESKTIYGMKKLLSLKLINNKDEAIEKNSFISLASLNELDLSYNQIEYLQNGTFSGYPKRNGNIYVFFFKKKLVPLKAIKKIDLNFFVRIKKSVSLQILFVGQILHYIL